MNKNFYCIYDAKAEFYNKPFIMRNNGEALRAFSDLAKDNTTDIGKHPEDYILYIIGSWNEQTGELIPSVPSSLGKAIEYISAKEN